MIDLFPRCTQNKLQNQLLSDGDVLKGQHFCKGTMTTSNLIMTYLVPATDHNQAPGYAAISVTCALPA